MHPELQCVFSVYVDDFKMAGRPEAMKEEWKLVRKVITTDEPAPFGKYLGCARKLCLLPSSSVPHSLIESLRKDGSDSVESLASKLKASTTEGTPSKDKTTKMLPAMQYDMSGYLDQCFEVYP